MMLKNLLPIVIATGLVVGCVNSEEEGKICLGNLKIAVKEENWVTAKKLANDPACQKAATIEGWRLDSKWVDGQRCNKIGFLLSALTIYKLDAGNYPSENEGLQALFLSIEGRKPVLDRNSKITDNYEYRLTDHGPEVSCKILE